MKFTIFGSSGYVGGAVAARLEAAGHEVARPGRADLPLSGEELGHVIYAIGLTSDFRENLSGTIDAHVLVLRDLMLANRFTSWLYLSSTRVYGTNGPDTPATEDSRISLLPGADSLYDLSKLLGEAWCLSQPNPAVRAARLSNVYGPRLGRASFLGSIVQALRDRGHTEIGEAASSGKDYVHIDDVADMLAAIAERGRHRIYNIAAGSNTTHSALLGPLSALCGGTVSFAEGAGQRLFRPISTARLKSEFGFEPESILANLPAIANAQILT